MTHLTAKLFSLSRFAPYLKLACALLALTFMACGEVAALESASPLEAPAAPQALVYVESIEFRSVPAEAPVEAVVYVESISFASR